MHWPIAVPVLFLSCSCLSVYCSACPVPVSCSACPVPVLFLSLFLSSPVFLSCRCSISVASTASSKPMALARVGVDDRMQFATSRIDSGWTNRREFRLPETEGGGEDLCSRVIILTTA